MKQFIKIKKSRWLPNSNTKMIHEDENGKMYLGPPINIDDNSTVFAETSDKPLKDGYYHIIKVIKQINN